jgi:release factor glutamine methyltransferase
MTEQVWTVSSALEWCTGFLGDRGDEHPRRSAEWLLSATTGLSRVELYAYHDRPLTGEERTALRESVKRRAAGEPLQYVTGEVAFRHIVVKVGPGVLIPRPETEVLVDEVLKGLEGVDSPRVADPCTGSGAIALSIAHERGDARVWATDIAPAAAAAARNNAERLGLAERVTVLEGDLMAPLPPELRGRLHVVVSNPPYIPTEEMSALPIEVGGFEPHVALDGGPDGLAVYRRVLAEALDWLEPGGLLAAELDESRVRTAAEEALQWYEDVRVVPDLTGRDRIVVARHPGRP